MSKLKNTSESFMKIRDKIQHQMKVKGFIYNKDSQTIEKDTSLT